MQYLLLGMVRTRAHVQGEATRVMIVSTGGSVHRSKHPLCQRLAELDGHATIVLADGFAFHQYLSRR